MLAARSHVPDGRRSAWRVWHSWRRAGNWGKFGAANTSANRELCRGNPSQEPRCLDTDSSLHTIDQGWVGNCHTEDIACGLDRILCLLTTANGIATMITY